MLPHRKHPAKWKEAAGCQSPRHHLSNLSAGHCGRCGTTLLHAEEGVIGALSRIWVVK
jgi:hypothetical protein